MVKTKICGVTNLEDARLCSSLGADALGFIFYSKSPRYIHPSKAQEIIRKLDPFIVKVGVFVDEKKEVVSDISQQLQLDALQFHGHESVRFCSFFKKKYKVVKTFFPKDELFLEDLERYNVDAYLFDVKWEEKLEGNRRLKKSILKKISEFGRTRRVIISGGLTPENISSVLEIVTPYAVDVASGVESFPGKKDKGLVKEFLLKVRAYDVS